MKNYTLHSCPLSQASKASNTKPAIRTRTRPVTPPPSQTPNPGGSSIPTACAPPVLTKKFQAALSKASEAGDQTPLVHVSIDRDKTGGHVFAALGLGQAHDLGKRSLDEFHHLIGHLSTQGLKLIVVQESCGFGYELHRTLAAMPGVEALIVHCQPLSGKRKTDHMDARQLCLRLQQYSSGNHDALRPIRVPTAEQVRARSEVTLRGQALGSIGRLQRQGWSLMQQHDVHDLPARWWTRVAWPKVRKRLSQQPDHTWLLTMLEPIRAIIVQLRAWQLSIEDLLLPDAKPSTARDEASDERDDAHSEEPASHPATKREAAKSPEANAEQEPITAASAKATDIVTPHGMGALTRAVLDRRIGDWHRFNNRKQVGSFIGACPEIGRAHV